MKLSFVSLAAALIASLAGCQPSSEQEVEVAQVPSPSVSAPQEMKLNALPDKQVPALTEVTTVRLATTAGDVVIEVYPQAAPNAAKRFVELVTSGYYDNTPVSRVVAGFVAQFGINWREPHKAWENRPFNDDPTLFALERGTLAFAKAGPNTNSTQVFINFRENNRLAEPQFNFTVFGKVVDGMDVVDSFVQVGDPSGGLDQGRLWNDGEAYLASLPVKPTMITAATIVQ
jgi:peptidyl-prolyl cis-trans isomerase A (cyclophilin A)